MKKRNIWIALILLLAVGFLGWRWLQRNSAEADDPDHTVRNLGEVPAAVAGVQRHSLGNTLTIAGEFKPFQDVDVHAKVAGYIKKIYVDVGAHVKEGQMLAVLEIPELAAELSGADAAVRRSKEEIRRAEGDLARAQSAHAAAHSAYARLKQAAEARTGLVAQQEIDDSQAKDLESEAQVSSSSAALSAAQQQLQVAEANQSILIVEFARHLHHEGKSLKEAVSTAARLRLRPILMTSLATLLARAIIGGLLVSVVVTVYLVPAAYLIVHRRKETNPQEAQA